MLSTVHLHKTVMIVKGFAHSLHDVPVMAIDYNVCIITFTKGGECIVGSLIYLNGTVGIHKFRG